MAELHDVAFTELTPAQLYAILRLRGEVFIVEQDCPFVDPDGRDAEPGARHLWIEDRGHTIAVARVVYEGDGRRVGRIATAAHARGNGHAGRLVEHFLATTDGPWYLDAQAHLGQWYATFGFERCGDDYLEDGITHTPMRRVRT